MDAVLIPLVGKRGEGLHAIVDAADEAIVSELRWTLGAGGYARAYTTFDGEEFGVFMHVALVGVDGMFVDHRNGNRLDNRRANIRLATRSQNNANRRGWSRFGFKGVKRQANGRFTAILQVDGRSLSFGTYGDAEQAALAYDRAALEHFGEFARLNFPLESVT